MAEQRAFIDFRAAGDTGVDDAESIQPVKNAEAADETVFQRPSENLRLRTEKLRGALQDLLYYRDYRDLILELTPGGQIAWGGPLSSGGTGIVTVTGTLKVSPRAAPAQPVRGALSVGTSGTNQLSYAVSSGGYATHGTNGITVEHRAAAGQALDLDISAGPARRILVTFDPNNAAHTTSAVKNLVDSAIAADSALAGKLVTTVSGAGVIAAVSETPLSASADDESHWIAGTLITALTTSRKLTVGDGIGIWYKHTIEPTTDPTDPKGSVAGGRAESAVSRGNHNIPAGSLFVTSDAVGKIPGAIVICRVGYGGQLIFLDGTRLAVNETTKLASFSTLLGEYNTNTVAAERTNAINTALTIYTSATVTPAINNALNNYTTSTLNPALQNRATTTYVDNAVSGRTTSTQVDQQITNRLNAYTPPANGVTMTQVDQQITTRLNGASYATTTDVANQVNTRTTPTQVESQITARFNSYVPPDTGGITAGQAQTIVDNHYNSVVRPGYSGSRASGAVQLIDVNYAPLTPKISGGKIYISMSLYDGFGTLHAIHRQYKLVDILGSGQAVTANKWMYLYSFIRNGNCYPILSDTPPWSDWEGNMLMNPDDWRPDSVGGPYGDYLNGAPLARTNSMGLMTPTAYGNVQVLNWGQAPCFGALRCKGNGTFMTQACANRVLTFPNPSEPGNRYAANALTYTYMPDHFWPTLSKHVTFAYSMISGGNTNAWSWYPSDAGGGDAATSSFFMGVTDPGERVYSTMPVYYEYPASYALGLAGQGVIDVVSVTF